MTLLSNYASSDPLAVSSERWAIAPLFQNLKTSGFKLEATRLEDDERLERLLALAFASAYRVGEWLAERTPIRLKQRGREEKRVFRLVSSTAQRCCSTCRMSEASSTAACVPYPSRESCWVRSLAPLTSPLFQPCK